MTISRLKTPVIFSAIVLAFFVGQLTSPFGHVQADQPKPDNTRLKQLLKDRVDAKKKIVEVMTKLTVHKAATSFEIQMARIELLRAELDLADAKAERISILEQILKLQRELLNEMLRRQGCGATELIQREIAVIEAEIELEREKLKP